MNTLVFDALTPNHDGPDGSYTRLLIVPIKPELQDLTRGLARALEQGGDLIDTLTSTRRHAYLIRPSLARAPKLHQARSRHRHRQLRHARTLHGGDRQPA